MNPNAPVSDSKATFSKIKLKKNKTKTYLIGNIVVIKSGAGCVKKTLKIHTHKKKNLKNG